VFPREDKRSENGAPPSAPRPISDAAASATAKESLNGEARAVNISRGDQRLPTEGRSGAPEEAVKLRSGFYEHRRVNEKKREKRVTNRLNLLS